MIKSAQIVQTFLYNCAFSLFTGKKMKKNILVLLAALFAGFYVHSESMLIPQTVVGTDKYGFGVMIGSYDGNRGGGIYDLFVSSNSSIVYSTNGDFWMGHAESMDELVIDKNLETFPIEYESPEEEVWYDNTFLIRKISPFRFIADGPTPYIYTFTDIDPDSLTEVARRSYFYAASEEERDAACENYNKVPDDQKKAYRHELFDKVKKNDASYIYSCDNKLFAASRTFYGIELSYTDLDDLQKGKYSHEETLEFLDKNAERFGFKRGELNEKGYLRNYPMIGNVELHDNEIRLTNIDYKSFAFSDPLIQETFEYKYMGEIYKSDYPVKYDKMDSKGLFYIVKDKWTYRDWEKINEIQRIYTGEKRIGPGDPEFPELEKKLLELEKGYGLIIIVNPWDKTIISKKFTDLWRYSFSHEYYFRDDMNAVHANFPFAVAENGDIYVTDYDLDNYYIKKVKNVWWDELGMTDRKIVVIEDMHIPVRKEMDKTSQPIAWLYENDFVEVLETNAKVNLCRIRTIDGKEGWCEKLYIPEPRKIKQPEPRSDLKKGISTEFFK
ncbi:SH3 domain-containing protein [Treponema sp.]|uniref:SH3 domain-containing protein n=1 Tax=Treponema sp. TaxID=166 RepID=UPI003FD7568F